MRLFDLFVCDGRSLLFSFRPLEVGSGRLVDRTGRLVGYFSDWIVVVGGVVKDLAMDLSYG